MSADGVTTRPAGAAPQERNKFYQDFPYTGPGTLAGRYMRQFWQPIFRSRDLDAGRATVVRVMSENFTLYRGATGTPHLVAHRCPHRGVQLSVGFVEGDDVRCLYHGWKFGADGRCIERPGELRKDGANIAIPRYPTGEFCGMIWAYLGESEPPAFPPFPEFEGEGFIECFRQHFPCNYFQSTENDWDLYHARYTHCTGEMHTLDYDAFIESERFEETDFGVVRTFNVPGGGVASTVWFLPTALRFSLPANNEVTRSGLGPARRPAYGITVPIDDHNCYFYIAEQVALTGKAADAYRKRFGDVQELRDRKPTPIEVSQLIRTTTMSVQDAKAHPALVAVEDLCTQVGQGEIADREAEFLGRTDRGIIFMRRIWQRELAALSEGRPTKAWAFMSEMPI